MTGPVGGYFGLETGQGRPLPWMASALAVQSGRMALRAALPAPPRTLWLPAYFCLPVEPVLESTGWRLRRYRLRPDLSPEDEVQPAPGDRVLLVDYFGLCAPVVEAAVRRFGVDAVVVDASMALFSPPLAGVPTAYSPRKFVGVPDGGFLVHAPSGATAGPADEAASRARMAHLLLRASGEVGPGREAFLQAEASLDADREAASMSVLTRRLLQGIDFDGVATRRIANARHLRDRLVALGFDPVEPGHGVPLCLPVRGMPAERWRSRLAERGVYCPYYWPGLGTRPLGDVERSLLDDTTFLPIDHRYGLEDMDRVLGIIDDLRRSA